jgi:hypothetical protein
VFRHYTLVAVGSGLIPDPATLTFTFYQYHYQCREQVERMDTRKQMRTDEYWKRHNIKGR